ncbi:MAG: histidine kinase dimerization/phospho-acceptor domain-containing protein [Candidatus Nitrosopolaris sp.]|jgi:two-component system sensor histidine kinase VicK
MSFTPKAGVLSYVFIFENLWKQIELYEDIKKSRGQLMILDKMQQEFINVAAHELRTPIQPILSITQILRSRIHNIQQQELLDIIIGNAKRLDLQMRSWMLQSLKVTGLN